MVRPTVAGLKFLFAISLQQLMESNILRRVCKGKSGLKNDPPPKKFSTICHLHMIDLSTCKGDKKCASLLTCQVSVLIKSVLSREILGTYLVFSFQSCLYDTIDDMIILCLIETNI